MSSIVTAVFKVTIGLLANKGRDKAAEKLKDGDITHQKFRALIVREIDDIKSKLDGLSRKDLLASISFFEEGIEFLYKVFDKARSGSEHGAATTQAACDEAFSLAEGMKKLELTGLDESATRALSNAKKRFEDSRRKATEAFNNEALQTCDRILAMQYRVMATILETVDNPEDAIASCRVCVEDLNSLSAIRVVLMFSSTKAPGDYGVCLINTNADKSFPAFVTSIVSSTMSRKQSGKKWIPGFGLLLMSQKTKLILCETED